MSDQKLKFKLEVKLEIVLNGIDSLSWKFYVIFW